MKIDKDEVKKRIKEMDWALYFLAIILFISSILCTFWISPRNQPFFVNDSSVWYPYNEYSTVPDIIVWIFGISCFFIIFLLEFLLSNNRKVSFWIGLRFFLNFLSVLCITSFSNTLIKNYVGELRPDFAVRCFGTYEDIPPIQYSGITITSSEQCISQDNNLFSSSFRTGRQSFLSGHAASSFSISTSLSLYLLWKIYDSRGKYGPFFNQMLILLLFIVTSFATFVGCSRIVDNKHHPWDVVGGAAYGALLSTLFFIYTMIVFYEQLFPARDVNFTTHNANSDHEMDVKFDD